MTIGRNQKVLIDSRMIEVMTDGSKDCTHGFHGSQVRTDILLLNETVHGLSHVSSMNAIVVRIGVVVSLFEQPCVCVCHAFSLGYTKNRERKREGGKERRHVNQCEHPCFPPLTHHVCVDVSFSFSLYVYVCFVREKESVVSMFANINTEMKKEGRKESVMRERAVSQTDKLFRTESDEGRGK